MGSILNGVATSSNFNYLKNSPTYVINSQTKFDAIIERTGANAYKIADSYTRVFFKILSGGYDCTSFLSGGDTWGYIKTNNCVHLEFEQGAYLDFKATQGYLWVDTNECWVNCGDIRGSGVGGDASAITCSYYLDAHRVTFWKCRTSSRYSNNGDGFVGFLGNETDTENLATSSAYHCSVYTIDGTTPVTGMKFIYNNYSSYVYDLDSSGSGATGTVIGFNYCRETVNPHVWDLQGAVVKGMAYCIRSTSPYVETLDAVASHAFAFDNCDQMSNPKAFDIDAHTGSGKAYAYYQCDNMVNGIALQITSTTNDAYGFRDCDMIAGCYANDVEHTGSVNDKSAYGFAECRMVGSCWANDIDTNGGGTGVAEGFHDNTYLAASYTDEAVNADNDYIDTADVQVTNNDSVPSVFT